MSYLDGIDISNWQKGLNIKKVDADFIIIKASEGVGYKDPCFEAWAKQLSEMGKPFGIYHFATGRTSGAEEAFYFWKIVQKYNGKAVFILDWEARALKQGVSYAKAFLDNFYKVSGKRCLIYMSQSVTNSYNWEKVAKTYKLWVAGYPYPDKPTKYYHPKQYSNLGAWDKAVMRQYSSHGSVEGYGARLDVNCFYGSKTDWDKLAGIKTEPKKEEPKKEEPKKTEPKKEEPKKEAKKEETKKSTDTLAQEVISGKWDEGSSRTSKLKKAGYDPEKVQQRVNKYYDIAKDVIKGRYGNGAERTEKIKKAGYNPATVQKLVNKLL